MSAITEQSYRELLGQLDDLVRLFEEHPDPVVQEQVLALLSGIDILHREALSRLDRGLRARGAEEALESLVATDRVVRTLLGLYGLAPLEVQEAADEAARRPHGPAAAPRAAPGAASDAGAGFVSISTLRRSAGRVREEGEGPAPAADGGATR